jgi:hypothetical protein
VDKAIHERRAGAVVFDSLFFPQRALCDFIAEVTIGTK